MTHAFNSGQRYVGRNTTRRGADVPGPNGTVFTWFEIAGPPSSNVAPSVGYLLHAVYTNGANKPVPSEGEGLHLDRTIRKRISIEPAEFTRSYPKPAADDPVRVATGSSHELEGGITYEYTGIDLGAVSGGLAGLVIYAGPGPAVNPEIVADSPDGDPVMAPLLIPQNQTIPVAPDTNLSCEVGSIVCVGSRIRNLYVRLYPPGDSCSSGTAPNRTITNISSEKDDTFDHEGMVLLTLGLLNMNSGTSLRDPLSGGSAASGGGTVYVGTDLHTGNLASRGTVELRDRSQVHGWLRMAAPRGFKRGNNVAIEGDLETGRTIQLPSLTAYRPYAPAEPSSK